MLTENGGARRDRTDDLLLAKPLFYAANPLKTVENRHFL